MRRERKKNWQNKERNERRKHYTNQANHRITKKEVESIIVETRQKRIMERFVGKNMKRPKRKWRHDTRKKKKETK